MIDDNLCDVYATAGDTHLGGLDLDNLMVKFCIKEFEKQHLIDISSDK